MGRDCPPSAVLVHVLGHVPTHVSGRFVVSNEGRRASLRYTCGMTIRFDDKARAARRRWLAIAVVAVAAGVVAAWWTLRPHADGGAAADGAFPWSRADSGTNTSAAPLPRRVAAGASAWAPPPPLPPVTGRPDSLSADEWAALQLVTKDDPDGPQQTALLVNFLQFQKKYQAWQIWPPGQDPAGKQQLARELLDAVVDKAARGMLSTPQAQQIQIELIDDIETDPRRREDLRREQAQRLPIGVPPLKGFPS